MEYNDKDFMNQASANELGYVPKLDEMHMSIGILSFSLSENYKILFVNEFLVLELGYDSFLDLKDDVGDSLLSLIHPEDREVFKAHLTIQGKGKDDTGFKYRIRCKNLDFIWVDIVGIHHSELGENHLVTYACMNVSEYMDRQSLTIEIEEKVKQRKLEMDDIADNFSVGLHIFHLYNGYSLDYINDELLKMCGYKREAFGEIFDNKYIMLVFEKDYKIFKDALGELEECPCEKKIEYRIRKKDGSLLWVRDSLKSMRGSDDKIQVYSIVIDISKPTEFEEDLGTVMNSTVCGIMACEYHLDSGSLIMRFINDTWCEMMGYSRNEAENVTTESIKRLVVRADLEEVYRNLQILIHNNEQVDCDFRAQTAAAHWIHMRAKVINRQKDLLLISAVFWNISDKQTLDRDRALQNYCLDQLKDSLSFGIIVKEIGLNNRPLYASKNVEVFLSEYISGIDVENTCFYKNIIHPGDYTRLLSVVSQYQKDLPQSFELEFRLLKKDGTIYWVKEIANKLDNFISPNAYLLIFTDITNIKNAEERLYIKEEEYRVAVLHSKDIVIRFNIHEGAVYVPSELAKQYNIPEKYENIPFSVEENGRIQPESVFDYINFYEGIKRGENRSVEIKVKCFDNTLRWFYGVSTVVFDENHVPVSAIISFSDITEKKEKDFEIEALKEADLILKIMVDSSSKIIMKYYFNTNHLEPISSSAKKIFEKIPVNYNVNNFITSEYISDESLDETRAFFEKMRCGNREGRISINVRDLDCGWKWYDCMYATIFAEDHSPLYSIIFCEDITEIREKELASLRFSEYTKFGIQKIIFNLEYNLTLDSFRKSEGVIPDCYISEFTSSYTKAYSRMLRDVLPDYKEIFQQYFSREHLLEFFEKGANHKVQEVLINYNGDAIWIRIFYQILKDPYTSFAHIWISCKDIDEEKRSELKLLEMAKIDRVTEIYNRAVLVDRVTEGCLITTNGLSRALIMLDVDGFGKVNDIFGHAYGDTILKDIAQTLKLVIGKEDVVARIGGDEFAIYSKEFSDISAGKERLRIIIAAVYRELKFGVKISISAGVALCPHDGKDFDTLYEKADIALYYAKLTGRNKYTIYDEAMENIGVNSMVTPIDEAISPNMGIYIRTFGYFEVFLNGEALPIQNAKAKELLALLVDRRGGYVSQGDIIACLWETESANKVTLARLRKVFMILRNTLRECGIEELVESKKGLRRFNTAIVNCDLYNYLSGKPEYAHLFNGSYMLNYSWGEVTIHELESQQ